VKKSPFEEAVTGGYSFATQKIEARPRDSFYLQFQYTCVSNWLCLLLETGAVLEE